MLGFYDEILYGDINNDGQVNIVDVVILVGFIFGEELTEEQLELADFNQDGIVNILDVVQMVNQILE